MFRGGGVVTTSDRVRDAESSRPVQPPRKPRIMDREEAERKWRRRQIPLAILGVLIVLTLVSGTISALNDRSKPFLATVESRICVKDVCTVYVDLTQPNGEVFTDDEWDKINVHSLRTLPDGRQVMTLYWYPDGDAVDTAPAVGDDVVGVVSVVGFLALIAFLIGFPARDIRRQAKPRHRNPRHLAGQHRIHDSIGRAVHHGHPGVEPYRDG